MKSNNRLAKAIMSIFLTIGLTSTNAISQTGPAGVGNNLVNKVWLDANSLPLPDATPVSIWNDISGNANHFTQGSPARRPLYDIDGINSTPSISFDGFNDVLLSSSISALESSELTYFIVYDRTTTTSDMLITSDYESNNKKWRTYMNNGQNTIISAHYSPTIKWVRYTDPPGNSFLSSHITTSSIRLYNQGDLEMSRSVAYTVPTGHNEILLGNRNPADISNYTFTGEIAEVIIYNSSLNNLERIMIENYLGAKYNMSIPEDYYAYNTTHRFGLIGLGDDGVNLQDNVQGSGILRVNSPTEMDTDEYFLTAHTNDALGIYNTSDIPASLPEHQRFERTWRVSETGEVGETTLTFGLSDFDFGSPDSYRLLVDSDGTFSDATILTGTYDMLTASMIFTVNLSDGDYFTIAGIQEILEIHSLSDGPWGTASTWDCFCIPSTNDLVFIDPFTTVSVNGAAFANNLTVEANGTLEMSSDNTLTIKGDLYIEGTLNCTDGTIELSGSAPQNVTIDVESVIPAVFHNVLINNSSTGDVTFTNGTHELHGLLSPNRGNIVIDPSAQFIVRSTGITTTGRIGSIILPTTITGIFSVERFMPPGPADWRGLCSPIIGETFNGWDPDMAMSGPDFPDGCASGPGEPCFKSVRFTDHSVSNNVLTSSDPIENGRGYELFVGSDIDIFSGTTLTSTGPINGPGAILKSYSTGWHTIGNPYASPIAYNRVTKSSSLSKYFYVYDSNTGTFQWYDEVSETSSVPEITSDGLIAISQGIWVFATSAGTITFDQSNKVVSNATYIRAPSTVHDPLKIKLEASNSHYSCTIELEEYSGATDYFDPELDITHLTTGKEKGPSFALASDEKLLRKNFIHPNGNNKYFMLNTEFHETGIHTISALNWENFRSYNEIILTDLLTGEEVNLKEQNYSFFTAISEESSLRFRLTLDNSKAGAGSDMFEEETEPQIIQQSHLITLKTDDPIDEHIFIELTNLIGQSIVYKSDLILSNNEEQIYIPENIHGLHIISIIYSNRTVSKKIML